MKNIFAITVNYNRPDSTMKLLKSLGKIKAEGFKLSIIVVDNGTNSKFTLEDENKDVNVIRPGTNTGFSKGNNIGIQKAIELGADYLMLINNDTIADPNLVINMLSVIERDERVGIVCPKIYFEKGAEFHKDRYSQKDLGHVIWFAGGFMDWENAKSIHRGVDEVDGGQYDKSEPIDFATGCCMLIKREVIEKVGLFDERYFLYYEDADLCLRVRRAGFDIVYAPAAFLYHENASSSGSGSPLHDYFLTRNQMIFGMKYAPVKTRLALVRQSLKLVKSGRPYQKRGIRDYYLRKYGKGSYFDK
jgi:GT2 family glycosyltransferase